QVVTITFGQIVRTRRENPEQFFRSIVSAGGGPTSGPTRRDRELPPANVWLRPSPSRSTRGSRRSRTLCALLARRVRRWESHGGRRRALGGSRGRTRGGLSRAPRSAWRSRRRALFGVDARGGLGVHGVLGGGLRALAGVERGVQGGAVVVLVDGVACALEGVLG